MKRAVAVMGAVAMMLVAASAFAQTNFSGKWTPDADKNPAPAAPAGGGGGGARGGGAPAPMTITQTATELTIEREGAPAPTVYKLDGKEQTVAMGQAEAKVTAKVDGATITISQTVDRGQGPMTTTIVYSMEGANLVVATTRPGRGGGAPTTAKVYYKKG